MNLDQAIDSFFSSPQSTLSATTTTLSSKSLEINQKQIFKEKLSLLFEKYKEPNDQDDLILVDGTIEFFNNIDVDPTTLTALVVAFNLECVRMCEFNRKGWINGWTALG